MILLDLRSAIVAGIAAGLPGLKEVKAHGGRFNVQELKAAAARSPSVRVACLGVQEVQAAAEGVEAVTVWGAFIVSGDVHPTSRDAMTLGLAGALLPLLPGACWGLEDLVDGARAVRAENLFSRDLDAQGVSLWAVTWRHRVTLGRVDAATLDDFLRCHVDYDINQDGEADATDEIALPQ